MKRLIYSVGLCLSLFTISFIPVKAAAVIPVSTRIIWNLERQATDSMRVAQFEAVLGCAEANTPSGFEILGVDSIEGVKALGDYREVDNVDILDVSYSSDRQSVTVEISFDLKDAKGLWNKGVESSVTFHL